MPQIRQQGRADSVGEWEDERLTRLVLRELEGLPTPLDILQGQGNDVTVPEAIRSDQEQHRIIAPSWRRGPINRQEQLAHGLPCEDPRQLFQAIHSGGINVVGECRWDVTAQREEAEKAADVGHHMLQCRAAQPWSDAGEKLFNRRGCEVGDPPCGVLGCQVFQQAGDRAPMLRNSQGREAPDAL